MGYYDGSGMALWQLAQQFTLADNFFMALSVAPSSIIFGWSVPVRLRWQRRLLTGYQSLTNRPACWLLNFQRVQTAPHYLGDFNFTPVDEISQRSYAVNTTQPPFQPSGTPPARPVIRYGRSECQRRGAVLDLKLTKPLAIPCQQIISIGLVRWSMACSAGRWHAKP